MAMEKWCRSRWEWLQPSVIPLTLVVAMVPTVRWPDRSVLNDVIRLPSRLLDSGATLDDDAPLATSSSRSGMRVAGPAVVTKCGT